MIIKDSTGKEYKINLGKYFNKEKVECSDLHRRVRQFLRDCFHDPQILEEIFIPSYNLYIDMYLPLYRLACEADGRHHDEYTPFFHGANKITYAQSRGRDRKKEEFCRINDIVLVRFTEEETVEQWTAKLKRM